MHAFKINLTSCKLLPIFKACMYPAGRCLHAYMYAACMPTLKIYVTKDAGHELGRA